MMKNFNRQAYMLFLAASAFLCPYPIECLNDLEKERRNLSNEKEPSPYQLRISNQHQDCVDDLFASDLNEDLKVTEEEYVEFIAARSRGGIVNEYSTLPFSLISNFIYGSCFCSFVLKIPNCCVGSEAGIDIDPDRSPAIEDNLITICRTTDEAIRNIIGTFSPTLSPTNFITEAPSSSPTAKPTGKPTLVPSSTPTKAPTTIQPTSAPTVTATAPIDPICIEFQYGIENDDGLTADDILTGFNNTFMNDLVIATRDTTIQVLNETLPRQPERRGLRQQAKSESTNLLLGVVSLSHYELDEITIAGEDEAMNGRRQAMYLPSNSGNRRLAFYTDSNPPVITDIIDNDFCPESDEGINCAIVDTRVCIYLEVGDNKEEVEDSVLDGFKNAFQNGSFQNAIPEDDNF